MGLTTPKPVFEDDAAEIGKGHEFITQTFPAYYDVANRIGKYASADSSHGPAPMVLAA